MLSIVILAGGSGTRFWPHGRRRFPKFLLPLAPQGRSLLADTVHRVAPLVSAERIFVVTGADQAQPVREELPELPAANIVVEPAPRDTAAAIAFGFMRATQLGIDPADPIAILPADAYIRDADGFRVALSAAARLAVGTDRIVTFSIPPTFPATGYGYIRAGNALPADVRGENWPSSCGAFDVAQFVEKPDLPTAESYVEAGHFYWNSGMFVATPKRMQAEIAAHFPELSTALMGLPSVDDPGFADAFATLPRKSIDYAVMERSTRIATVTARFDWSDVGTWGAVADLRRDEAQIGNGKTVPPSAVAEIDPAGNVKVGDAVALDAERCFLQTDAGVVAVVGVSDVIVVRHGDAVLVCHRDSTEQVKHIVEALRHAGHYDKI